MMLEIIHESSTNNIIDKFMILIIYYLMIDIILIIHSISDIILYNLPRRIAP